MILRDQEENPARGSVVCGKGNHWGTLPPGTDTYVLTASSNDPSGTGLTWAATGAGGTVGSTTGDVAVACPDAYGAMGDGVNDDTNAINAAIASGLDVWLTPGKTYLTWGGHFLGAGQVLFGNGATFQAPNQVSQACSATVTSGSNTCTVTSATGLVPGQWITVSNAPPATATGGINYDGTSHKIGSVNGLTVTIDSTWGLTVAGGTVYTTGSVLTLSGAASRVVDLIINGNSANVPWARWETTWGILLEADRTRAEHCYLYNMPGESFYVSCNYVSVEACATINCNGNGYHFSNTEHPVIHNCTAVNCNLNTNVGHYMGGIGWSDAIQDATVSDCYISGCLNGFGSIDSAGNSDVTISNCTIRSCSSTGFYIAPSTDASAAGRIVITGNRIYACPTGILLSKAYSTSPSFPNRVTISGNSFDLCTTYSIQLGMASLVSVTGNRFEGATGTGSLSHIWITDSQNISITGNLFNGGAYGIWVNSPNFQTRNVTVSGNTFSSQYGGAIRFQDPGMLSVQANGNTITNDTTAGNNYVAISNIWPCSANGNSISLTTGGGTISGVVGILLNQYVAVDGGGAYALDNVIRGTSQYGIQTWGGSYGSVIASNLTTATTPLQIGGGTVTTPAVFGTPTISGGAITVVPVISGGAGYSGIPYVGAIGGGGSGYTLTPVMSSGAIASVSVTSGGTGFTTPPTIFASGNFVANNLTVL